MAQTVDLAFTELANRLTTPAAESLAAKSHRASLENCLEQNFGMTHFFQSGSFGNGTNIPAHSDVDRFSVIPSDMLNDNSRVVLRKVRKALVDRFPTTHPIRIRPPGVTLPFGAEGAETTEIIPAQLVGENRGYRVFQIPSPENSGWIVAAPEAHRAFVRHYDEHFDGQIKRLIRFLKLWKYERSVPIQSIYIELAVSMFVRDHGLTRSGLDIARILNWWLSNRLQPLNDPMEICGQIPPTGKVNDREETMRKLSGSAKMASKAALAELEWRFGPSQNFWNMFFRGKFPNR